MVKDYYDSENGNPLPSRMLLFPISSKGFYMHQTNKDIAYHGICYTSCEAMAGTGYSIMSPPCGINPMTYRTMSKHTTSEMRSAP